MSSSAIEYIRQPLCFLRVIEAVLSFVLIVCVTSYGACAVVQVTCDGVGNGTAALPSSRELSTVVRLCVEYPFRFVGI